MKCHNPWLLPWWYHFGIRYFSSYIFEKTSVSLHIHLIVLIAHKYSGNVCIRREYYSLMFMLKPVMYDGWSWMMTVGTLYMFDEIWNWSTYMEKGSNDQTLRWFLWFCQYYSSVCKWRICLNDVVSSSFKWYQCSILKGMCGNIYNQD